MNNFMEKFEKNEERGSVSPTSGHQVTWRSQTASRAPGCVGGGYNEEECERCSWWLEGVITGVAATVFFQRFKIHTSMLLKDSTFQTLTLHALNLALSRVWKGIKIPFKDIIDIILTAYAGNFPYLKAACCVVTCLVLLPITILEFVGDLVWMMLVKVGSKFSHLHRSSTQKEEEEEEEQDQQLIGVELGAGVKQAYPPPGVELGYPLPGVKQAYPPTGVELGYPPPSLNGPVAAAKDLWETKATRSSHYTPESYIYGGCVADSVKQSQIYGGCVADSVKQSQIYGGCVADSVGQSQISQSCPILDLILPSIPSSPPGQSVKEVSLPA